MVTWWSSASTCEPAGQPPTSGCGVAHAVIDGRPQVGVPGQCGGRLGVAKSPLDPHDVAAGGDQPGREEVPQVVEPDALDPSAGQRGPPAVADGVLVGGTSSRLRRATRCTGPAQRAGLKPCAAQAQDLRRPLSPAPRRHKGSARRGPGLPGAAERLLSPARPARTRTPALRISHFPGPPPRRHRPSRPVRTPRRLGSPAHAPTRRSRQGGARPTGPTTLTATSAGAHSKEPIPVP